MEILHQKWGHKFYFLTNPLFYLSASHYEFLYLNFFVKNLLILQFLFLVCCRMKLSLKPHYEILTFFGSQNVRLDAPVFRSLLWLTYTCDFAPNRLKSSGIGKRKVRFTISGHKSLCSLVIVTFLDLYNIQFHPKQPKWASLSVPCRAWRVDLVATK